METQRQNTDHRQVFGKRVAEDMCIPQDEYLLTQFRKKRFSLPRALSVHSKSKIFHWIFLDHFTRQSTQIQNPIENVKVLHVVLKA